MYVSGISWFISGISGVYLRYISDLSQVSGLPLQILAGGDTWGIDVLFATKSGGVTNKQKMCMIRSKSCYLLVLSLVNNLLFYHNFSPKHVLFVKSFKHK